MVYSYFCARNPRNVTQSLLFLKTLSTHTHLLALVIVTEWNLKYLDSTGIIYNGYISVFFNPNNVPLSKKTMRKPVFHLKTFLLWTFFLLFMHISFWFFFFFLSKMQSESSYEKSIATTSIFYLYIGWEWKVRHCRGWGKSIWNIDIV